MSAPDVNDVRARFEAGIRKIAPKFVLDKYPDGSYLNPEVQAQWRGYRAAHADLSGEVRELPAYRYEAPSWQEIAATEGDAMAALKVLHHAGSLINAQLPGTAQLCAKWSSLIGTIKAAVTHQEKP